MRRPSGFTLHHFSMYYVYIIQSLTTKDIYIGSTNHLHRRLDEHNAGKNFSTKTKLPWQYIYLEAYVQESHARLREKRLKYNGNAIREVKRRIGLLPKRQVTKSGAGFTLVEVIITASIFAIAMTLLGVFASSGMRAWNQNRQQVDAQETARTALARMTKIMREAQPSNNGSYPIATAAAQSVVFYANVDTDTDRERVRFYLQGTSLMLGTIQPVGEPASYPAGNEAVSTLATGIQNGTAPVFQYYDTSYTGSEPALALPVNLQDVRLVHVNLSIDADASQPPSAITLETSIAFRNLKDNL